MQKSIQCAVVGDGFVGKSSLVQKFVNGKFDKTYIATLKDDYSAKVSTNGDVFRLNVSDIAGEVSRAYFYIFRKRCSSAYHFLIDVLCIIHYFYCLFFVLQHEDLSSIATSDIFIVCFSLVDDDSMDSVLNFWIPKIDLLTFLKSFHHTLFSFSASVGRWRMDTRYTGDRLVAMVD